MAKYERQLRARASEIAKYLENGIRADGMAVNLTDQSLLSAGAAKAWLFMYDSVDTKAESRFAASMLLFESGDSVSVTVIGTAATGRKSENPIVRLIGELLDLYNKDDKGSRD